jgi:hypothetical protein
MKQFWMTEIDSALSASACNSGGRGARRIPLWLKLTYTAFMAVLVPIYLRNYGPTNSLFLRRRLDHHAGRHLDREPVARLHVCGWHHRRLERKSITQKVCDAT